MDYELAKYLSVIIVSLTGWVIVHYLNARRDLINKRREIRIEHLLEAYRDFEFASSRKERTIEQDSSLESAVAIIQLLGTKDQAKIIVDYMRKTKDGDAVPVDEVLKSLRDEIRNELGLKGGIDNVVVFRLTRDS